MPMKHEPLQRLEIQMLLPYAGQKFELWAGAKYSTLNLHYENIHMNYALSNHILLFCQKIC